MFFKNLLVYRLNLESELDVNHLEEALAQKRAKPCASQVASTYGFIAPLGEAEDAPLVHSSQGFMLICAEHEERLLPTSVVRDAVSDKVSEIEVSQGRKVYRKEKDQIKDEVIQALMPRAFIRKTKLHAALDTREGFLYIDASSSRRADEIICALREVLGSFPARPVAVECAPAVTFTKWLRDQGGENGFSLLSECELRDTCEDGGIVRIKRQDLTGEEVQTHLGAGKKAVSLGLAWQDKLTFVLDESLSIKRLRFDDLLHEEAHENGGDEAAGQFDASFVLMMLTLRQFTPELLLALGGEPV